MAFIALRNMDFSDQKIVAKVCFKIALTFLY